MNIRDILDLKGKRNISVLTCYDYSMAFVLNKTEIDVILVGDSMGMVMFGHKNTGSVTLDEMIVLAASVKRGAPDKLLVFDMPVNTYDSPDVAYRNVMRVKKETGIEAVKIEGAVHIVKSLVNRGVPVMGHVGLKPQTAKKYAVVGRDDSSFRQVFDEAKALQDAGAFAVVLECVPTGLGKKITDELAIPTIGIGGGKYCDGQVLVLHDLLGLYDRFQPKFVRKYADFGQDLKRAVDAYVGDVLNGDFPSGEEEY